MSLKNKKKKKVLFLSINDYAGSGHRYSEAVNRHGKYTSSSLKFKKHKYGYNTDYCILEDKKDHIYKNFKNRLIYAQKLIDEADILHFKGDYPVLKKWGLFKRGVLIKNFPRLEIPVTKPIVITTSGSIFRRHIKGSVMSLALFPMDIMKRYTNARTVTTPDLNYPEFDSQWLPLPLDTMGQENQWLKNNHNDFIIGHSPSSRDRKGTDTILVPAIKIVKKHFKGSGKNIELEIIEGTTYEECLRRKKRFSLFWDQCGFGFYGNALVEACQWGIPSMAWLSSHSLSQMVKKDREALPIFSFDKNPKSCAKAIIDIIESDMKSLSIKTKKWADNTHSYEAVGKKISDIYDGII